MQIVTKLPNGTTEVAQNDSEQPILLDLHFFQSFPLKWLRMTWNEQFRPIHHFSNLFPLKWLGMIWNEQFHPIHHFSNLFPPKWLKMTLNGQFCLIHNFSNLFPLKSLRMTQNEQFHPNWLLRVILSHFCGKRWKSCKSGKIGHSEYSEPLWWEKIGKVMNWAKLAVPSHSEPLQWYHLVV